MAIPSGAVILKPLPSDMYFRDVRYPVRWHSINASHGSYLFNGNWFPVCLFDGAWHPVACDSKGATGVWLNGEWRPVEKGNDGILRPVEQQQVTPGATISPENAQLQAVANILSFYQSLSQSPSLNRQPSASTKTKKRPNKKWRNQRGQTANAKGGIASEDTNSRQINDLSQVSDKMASELGVGYRSPKGSLSSYKSCRSDDLERH